MPWKKGESGNPSGRPKVAGEIRELARAHTADALGTLISIAKDPKKPAAARVAAASAILDRGYGRPAQPIEGGDKPFTLTILEAGLKAIEAAEQP